MVRPKFGTRTDLGKVDRSEITKRIAAGQTQQVVGEGGQVFNMPTFQRTIRGERSGEVMQLAGRGGKPKKEEKPPVSAQMTEAEKQQRRAAYLIGEARDLDPFEREQLKQEHFPEIAQREAFRQEHMEAFEQERETEWRQQLAQQLGVPVEQIPSQQQMGQTGVMGPDGIPLEAGEATPINRRQTFLAAVASDPVSLLIGGYAGVKVGALAGAKVGAMVGAGAGPVGAAVGATAGVILGVAAAVYRNAQRNVKSQKTDNLGAQTSTLRDGTSNLRQLYRLANLDPANAERYIGLFNQQLTKIDQAHSQMKIDTSKDLNLALGIDGTRARQDFENFYAPGGRREVSIMRMQEAIGAPNPEMAMQEMMTDMMSETEGVLNFEDD